jgi:hypothetical protein
MRIPERGYWGSSEKQKAIESDLALILPLGAPTFQTFRLRGTLRFLDLFLLEAHLDPRVVVTAQLHAGDFCPKCESYPRPEYSITDLLPRRPWGIKAKLWVRERNRQKISSTTCVLLGRLQSADLCTLAQIYRGAVGERRPNAEP